MAIAFFPGRWLATAITSGAGLARSGWALELRFTLLVLSLVAVGAGAGLLPELRRRGSRRLRIAIGIGLCAGGFAALGLTTFYATTYIRAYRGVLVVSALLFEIGFPLAIERPPALARWRFGRHAALSIACVFVLGFGLSRAGGGDRAQASYTISSHTLVAQKLQPILLLISPVFHTTARIDLEQTRLARTNRVPVPPMPRGSYRGKNVLFVTFDALRADMVQKTLAGHAVAPNIAALASSGFSFRRAVANYSHTSRSLLSILAGSSKVRFSWEIDVPTDPADVRARTRLPRLVRAAGYESVVIVMSGRHGDAFFDVKNLQGFDRHIPAGTRCEQQVAAFRSYVRDRTDARPFWTWVHIFDTHFPVVADPPDKLFGDSVEGQYAAGVHHADRCLGDLLAVLREASQWDKTVVVVAADHGEALGEHARQIQHSTCYWHDLHIPLVFRLPDRDGAGASDYPIQLSDLLPTLANLLGIAIDEPEVDGDDLSGLFVADPDSQARESLLAMSFAQGHAVQYPCSTLVADDWHLIYTDETRTYELYNVAADPAERQNLASDRPDIFDWLQPVLDTFRDRTIP
jgi:arylsulfatase A-like enzyme